MIVRNSMTKEPTVVSGDTLVTDVKRLLTENNLRAVPVVDDGRLRGLITRANCLRAAENVTRTQDHYEIDYFVTRLKARDIMVRHPATVDIGDTMEHCLQTGQDSGISQFPVLDNDNVVGIVSAAEIFHLAAHMLGAWEKWSGVTLAAKNLEAGDFGKIAVAVEATGATIHSLFSIQGADPAGSQRKVIIRFQNAPLQDVINTLEAQGYEIFEACDEVQNCRDVGARDEVAH